MNESILKKNIKIVKSFDNNLQVIIDEDEGFLLDLPENSDWWVMHDYIKNFLKLPLRYKDPIVLKLNEEIEKIKPTSKTNRTTYSISPDLPRGIELNSNNGEIFGIPLESTFLKKYNISDGENTFPIHIAVTEPPPSNLEYTFESYYELNSSISLKPKYIGNVDKFLIDSGLPEGLTLNEITGEIIGIAKERIESKSFKITAKNKFGECSSLVVLEIKDSTPLFSYGTPHFILQRDRSVSIVPEIFNKIDIFSISPNLPEGLLFDEKSGSITGSAKKISPVKYTPDIFKITSYYEDKQFFQEISILRVIPSPRNLKYESYIKLKYEDSVLLKPISVEGDGHTLRYCAWLPEDLKIDILTGEISGVAKEIGLFDVKVVVSNSSGTDEFSIKINIVE